MMAANGEWMQEYARQSTGDGAALKPESLLPRTGIAEYDLWGGQAARILSSN